VIAQGVVGERTRGPEPRITAGFRAAGVPLEVDSDDRALIDEVASLLGRPVAAAPAASPRLSAVLHSRVPPGAFARLVLEAHGAPPAAPTDLVLAASSADFPFDLLESTASRVVLAPRGRREPALVMEGSICRFALFDGWRKAVGLILLHRLMRCREDAIFFHAASVVLGGAALLVGVKGAGKSTLALALAARGHALLGDEHACYLPANGAVAPFRRPVGVKPGPRAAAVDALLARLGRWPERDGMMRVPVEDLLPGPEPAPAPLRAIVFLGGFAGAPRIEALDPARSDVGRLQPVGVSLLNAPPARRVFEMSKMLRAARVFALTAGAPDATAAALEAALPA
jgi:hypothetical protein